MIDVDDGATSGDGAPVHPFIDLHPHLFNAHDVPVAEFVARAVRRYKREDGSDDVERNERLGRRAAKVAGLAPPIEKDRARLHELAGRTSGPEAAGTLGMVWESLRSRVNMVERLDAMTQRRCDLFVPLGVDMEPGVGGRGRSSPSEQFGLMEDLSEATIRGHIAGVSGIVLPMVGYHPARRKGDCRNSLESVQDRVKTGRAIGVKVYPPMGFRPLGNDERSLDDNLRTLYEWCNAEQVPIVAHCSKANATAGSESFARAANWLPVLDKYSDLRLDLAHAGGIGEWDRETMAFIATQRDRFVFADVSNHDHGHGGVAQFMAWFAQFADHERRWMRQRIMFGTDYWFVHMHGDADEFLDRYLRLVSKELSPAVVPDFAGLTAQRFLGFDDRSNKNRIRVIDRLRRLHAAQPFTIRPSMVTALALDEVDIASITGSGAAATRSNR